MRVCAVTRRLIDVCNCDMFSVVNVYHRPLIHTTQNFKWSLYTLTTYVCCGESYIASNECDEPTSCPVQPIGAQGCEIMYFGCFRIRGELGFLNCDAMLSLSTHSHDPC